MTNAPEKIYNWMDTQLSLARHNGGCTYQGHSYVIDFNDLDRPLVRLDIFTKETEGKKQKVKTSPKKVQLGLEL